MRKNWIWGLSLLLIGGMASCKSSQSAYKAAYEKAQEKKIEEPVTAGTTPVAEQPVVTLLRRQRRRLLFGNRVRK